MLKNYFLKKLFLIKLMLRHIVLDLDATLIHCIPLEDSTYKIIKTNPDYNFLDGRTRIMEVVDIMDDRKMGTGVITRFLVILRPYVFEFIDYLLHNFEHISIYSAGQKRYVRALESILFPVDTENYNLKLQKVLSASSCEFGVNVVLKDLKRVGFDLNETLIIDDNPTSFTKNPNNVIHIPGYTPGLIKEEILRDDKTLLNIKNWLSSKITPHCNFIALDKSTACL